MLEDIESATASTWTSTVLLIKVEELGVAVSRLFVSDGSNNTALSEDATANLSPTGDSVIETLAAVNDAR